MKTRYLYLLKFILTITDIAIVNLCFFATFYMVFPSGILTSNYEQLLLIYNLIWFIVSSWTHLYHDQIIQHVTLIYKSTIKGLIMHIALIALFMFFSKQTAISNQFVIINYIVLSCCFVVSRLTGTGLSMLLKRHFNIRRSVGVLGMSDTGLRLADFFEKNNNNFLFQGVLTDEEQVQPKKYADDLKYAKHQIRKAGRKGIKDLYVSIRPEKMVHVDSLLLEAEKNCVRLKFVPDLGGSIASPFILNHLEEFPVISIRKEPLEEMDNRFKKRLFDIIFSSLVIIFLMSWLYPIIALLIKIHSPGPVLFKQLRSGRNNEPFWCYKFRSMKMNIDSDNKQASKDDDRITKIGTFLRKTSLDELPQFFNVLIGNMSVSGPRPHMLKHTEQYTEIINHFMARQFLKPGITGWAQVNGFRGETKESWKMEKRVEYDIWYLENWALLLDVKIIFFTVMNVIKGEENAF